MNFRRFNKYIGALTLAAACTVNTMGATVSDVASNHWAYEAVMALADKGIMVPTSQGEFKPNQLMSYFEVADVMAKATGYIDVDIATNVDEAFKTQIKNNYEKQKATLGTYAAKYTNWDKSYDKQIAYLLGRGYLSTSDLDKFITKSNQVESKATITKEELSVWVVRLLGKENTAKSTYTSTGFRDESSITESYRPHMAYLKSIGLISGDTLGNASPKTKVTKALCAQMISSALEYKDSTSDSNSETPVKEIATIKKVLTKNTTEYYVSLLRGANSSYYTLKASTKVIDANGNQVAITDVPIDSQAKVTIALENKTEYITSLQLVTALDTNTPPIDQTPTSSVASGTIVGTVNNDVLRLKTADGTVNTYLLQENCPITLNGTTVAANQLSEGDAVTITVVNTSTVTKIVATTGTSSLTTNGELTAKKIGAEGYVLTLKQNNNESSITIPETATIKRNNKSISAQEIRIGDMIKVIRVDGVITQVEATGVRQTITGTIKEVHLAQPCKIVVDVNNEIITYNIANDAELYDNSAKTFIGVRDLHLGQEISFILESKEMISLDVENITSSIKLMGTVTSVSKNSDYIDVLVDYDPMTGDSRVYKRIQISSDTTVLLDGKTQNRNILDEEMEILITYEYLDDTVPQKIQIIR